MAKLSLVVFLLFLAGNTVTSHGFMTSSARKQRAVHQAQSLATAQAIPTVMSRGPDQLVRISVNAEGVMQSGTEPALVQMDEQEQDAGNPKQLLELLESSAFSSPTLAKHKLLEGVLLLVIAFFFAVYCSRCSESATLVEGNRQSTNDVPRSLEDCRTVVDRLRYWASLTPEKTLFTWVDKEGREVKTFTYHQFQAQSSALASKLRRCWKVLEGDQALLVYEPCLSFNIAFTACLKAGVVAVPVYPPNPANLKVDLAKLTAVADDCVANTALVSSAYYWGTVWTICQSWPDLVWHVTDSRAAECITLEQCDGLMIDPEKLAFLQYTSGSTGDPKGVMITHANLLHNTLVWSPHNGSSLWDGKIDIGVSWLPQYHDLGLVLSQATITTGATLIQFSAADFIKRPMLWLELISRYQATVTASPHFGWVLAAKACRRQINVCSIYLCSLRMVLDAAEPIHHASQVEVIRVLKEYGLRDGVLNPGYGLAEHTAKVCHSAGALWEDGRAGLGRPCLIPGRSADQAVAVKIVDPETCAEMPHGAEGEVWVDSPSKAKGYFGKAQLTEDVFHAKLRRSNIASDPDTAREFLRTGDKGFIKDGVLFLSGRYKNIIIVGGRNYHPHDVEQTVERAGAPYLRPGCVAVVGIPRGTEQVVIVAEVRPQADPGYLVETIRQQVEQDHGIDVHGLSLLTPRCIPKTTSGKLRHSEIARLWESGPLSGEFHRKCWDCVADVAPILWVPKADRESRQAQVSVWLCDELARMTGGPVSEDMKLGDIGLTSLGVIRLHTRLHVAAATTTDADLTDLQSSGAPQVRQRLPEEALGATELFELCTVKAIANAIERAKFPTEADFERENWLVSKQQEREPYEGGKLPSTLVYSLQMVGVMFLILGVVTAVSATLKYQQLVAKLNVPWLLQFAALAFSFPVWMLLFSVEVALVKWLIVGSYRPCRVARWSLGFLQWWLVDRFVDVWERSVGCWLVETLILNIFYVCCGAQVAVTAQLAVASLREFDLVVIGAGAEVNGDLVCRVIRQDGLAFGTIRVGAGAEIQADALVPPMVDVQKGAVLTCMSVPDSGVTIPAGEVWHGHPATKVGEGTSIMNCHLHTIVIGKTLLLLLHPVLVHSMRASLVAVAGNSMRWFEPDVLISPSSLGHVFVVGGCAAVAVLILKWLLFWRVEPNQVTGNAWWKLRVFFLGLWFRLALRLFLCFWIEGMPSAARLWYRLLGSQIHHGAIIFNVVAVAPQWADLFKVGTGAFITTCSIVPSEARPVWIGEKASIGYCARVEGGCTIRDGAAIGPLTLLEAGTDVAPDEFRFGSHMRTKRNVAMTPQELPAWLSIAEWLLRLGSIAMFALMMWPSARISSSIESPVHSLTMAIPTWFLFLFVFNLLATKALHPGRELDISVPGFTTVAWSAYNKAQIMASSLVLPFLGGSWLATRWHQGLGARTACDAIWLGASYMDQPLLDVGHGAVVDGRILTGHSRLPDGTMRFKRSTLGDGACLYPGGVMLGGTEVGQDTTLGFKSFAHPATSMKTPGRIWSGSPARLSTQNTALPATVDEKVRTRSAVVPGEVCGAPNVHSIRAHLNWYLLVIACLALSDFLLNILMGVKQWSASGIEWGWACFAALAFITINVVMKNCLFLSLRRCLLHWSCFTPSEVQEINGPRWHLDDHWLENLLADPLRKRWAQVIDATCRKGGHLWIGLSNYVMLVPLVIGADRTTEAAIGGSFVVFVMVSLRCAAIWRFRGGNDLWRWCHLTFLFGASDRIRDGRLAHLNTLIASISSSWGRLACLAIGHLGLPPEKKHKDLWRLITMLAFLPLVVGDTLGELIGTPFGRHTFQVRGLGEINKKSIEGCVAVLVGSLVPCLLVAYFNKDLQLQAVTKIGLPCVLALLTTATETLSFRSTDNLFIPVVNSVAIVAWWAILES